MAGCVRFPLTQKSGDYLLLMVQSRFRGLINPEQLLKSNLLRFAYIRDSKPYCYLAVVMGVCFFRLKSGVFLEQILPSKLCVDLFRAEN